MRFGIDCSTAKGVRGIWHEFMGLIKLVLVPRLAGVLELLPRPKVHAEELERGLLWWSLRVLLPLSPSLRLHPPSWPRPHSWPTWEACRTLDLACNGVRMEVFLHGRTTYHGPASLSMQLFSHWHVPPKLAGRFSFGTCACNWL